MPRIWAAFSALPRSREAIAVTSLHAPFCMPGMTFVTAIFAVLRTPQRTLDIARYHSRKGLGGKTCGGPESASGTQNPFSEQFTATIRSVSAVSGRSGNITKAKFYAILEVYSLPEDSNLPSRYQSGSSHRFTE